MERDNRRLYSSMRFEGDGVTKVVTLTFELREDDGLSVDFGYGLVESGYIIDYDSQPVLIIFDEPLPKDQTITIRRLTQISEVPHVFQKTGNAQGGSPFNAQNIDENFENITRASQDAMDSQTLASETLEDMSGIKDEAFKYRNEAEGFRNEAEVLRDSTVVKAEEASISAGKAKTSEVNAKTSETNAKHSEEEAKRWAEEAQEVVIGDILVEGEGDSTTKAMTQKSVTESFNNIRTDMQLIDAELATKFDKSDLVNTSGQSSDKVMSQKAVTDFVNNKDIDTSNLVTKDDITNELGDSTEFVASQALVSSHGLGYGQKWVDVTSNRAKRTVYTNETKKPIWVKILTESLTVSTVRFFFKVDDIVIPSFAIGGGSGLSKSVSLDVLVPPGSTYEFTEGADIQVWLELR